MNCPKCKTGRIVPDSEGDYCLNCGYIVPGSEGKPGNGQRALPRAARPDMSGGARMTPYYEAHGITIYHGDCLEVLPQLELRGGFVVTDPPYTAGMKYGEGTNDRRDWREWVRWLDARRRAWERVAPEAMFFLSQTAYRHYVKHSRRGVDWDCVWLKPLSMAVCAAPYMPHWEHLAYAGKRRKGQLRHPDGTFVKHSDGGFGSDVFVANVEIGTDRLGHPTPKPMALMRDIVSRCGTDAPFLLDPFAGSGTLLAAAREQGRPAIGIEIEERWCEAAALRVEHGTAVAGGIQRGHIPLPFEVPA